MPKAAIMPAPGEDIRLEDVKYPTTDKGGVVLKTLFSEVCGTDVHLSHGRLEDVPYPIIPGHISVGIIEEINGTVADIEGRRFSKGEVVTFLDVHETCNNCWYCSVAKATTRCPSRKVYGITYSANDGLHGGWSDYIYLKPGVKIMPLDGCATPEEFIAGGCGLVTSFHAVERSGVRLGDTVVVQGTGPVGLFAIAWARLAGAHKVIAVGAPEIRLKAALDIGADSVVDVNSSSAGERISQIKAATGGRGADVTIECSGNPHAVSEGMNMTRDAGNYLIVGQYTNAGNIDINPHLQINKKHLNILGCWGFDYSHLYKAVKMMPKITRNYDVTSLITKKYTLSEANEGLRAVANLDVVKAVITPD